MARNIIVYSDGTGQDGGVRPDQRLSNVYKLYRATRIGPDSVIDPSKQIAFYDAGLGTESDAHGLLKIQRTIIKMLASVMGRGIGRNIVDCYEFIINHWKPGDRIFIIGFSRGAYTARCIAQVLALCGVPQHAENDPGKPLRTLTRDTRLIAERAVHQVYEHGAGHPREAFEAERDELARRFREGFGSGDGDAPNAHPHFIGVFDTVAALGASGPKFAWILGLLIASGILSLAIPIGFLSLLLGFRLIPVFVVMAALTSVLIWAKIDADSIRSIDDFPKGSNRKFHRIHWRADNYDRGLSRRVGYARQASAIDESRKDFPRVPWGRNTFIRDQEGGEPPPLVQLWFAGNHSDIGGSYTEEESRLSDIALAWMVEEATSIPEPLIIDRARLSLWPDATAMQHCEVSRMLDQISWMPWWFPRRLREGWPIKLRKPAGYPIHPSVFERFAQGSVVQTSGSGPYRPTTLSGDERFAGYFAAPGFMPPDFAATIFHLEGPTPVKGTLETLKSGLCELLRAVDAQGAVIVMLPSNPVERNDPYRDALALRHLDGLIKRTALRDLPVGCVVAGDPDEHLPGRILLGAAAEQGRQIAASIGQMTIIEISADGSVVMQPSIIREASISLATTDLM